VLCGLHQNIYFDTRTEFFQGLCGCAKRNKSEEIIVVSFGYEKARKLISATKDKVTLKRENYIINNSNVRLFKRLHRRLILAVDKCNICTVFFMQVIERFTWKILN
jgi:hypothetical protein